MEVWDSYRQFTSYARLMKKLQPRHVYHRPWHTNSLYVPDGTFTILEPQNPFMDEFHMFQKRRSTIFEVLNFRNVRSGIDKQTDLTRAVILPLARLRKVFCRI